MDATLKNKLISFMVVIFMVSWCNVYAQQNDSSKSRSRKEKFAFGPKISANFTKDNLHLYSIERGFVPGADLGLFFRFTPARIYIQPEVNYVIRRINVSYNDWGWEEINLKEETNHVGVPIFVGLKIVDFKNFKIRCFAGPELNFALRKSAKNYFQLGFHAGVGFDVWRFTIDAGYSFLAYTGWKKTNSNIFKIGIGFKCY